MNKQWPNHMYKNSLQDRQHLISSLAKLSADEESYLTQHSSALQNNFVENYFMNYQLPEGLATNVLINGHYYQVPMVTEEPSVIAAACNGAKRIAASGGFHTTAISPLIVGQVVIDQIDDFVAFRDWCQLHEQDLLKIANDAHPSMKERGAGAKAIRIRQVDEFASLDLLIDVDQAMGANIVNTMAEAVGHYLRQHRFHVLAAILSNYSLDNLQTVTCSVDYEQLATTDLDGQVVAQRIAQLSKLAQVDTYRAVTHNKGIMNGMDAVVIASGNDWRANEAAINAYAAQGGQYRGLSIWKLTSSGLEGILKVPLMLGTVGGSIKLTQQAKINYKISQIHTSQELRAGVVSVGLAQNLSALRAIATSGIQAGHMKLQYRSLALSVGAKGSEIPDLVDKLKKASHVDKKTAQTILTKIREDR